MSYTVAQNTSFLTVASIAQKIVSFVYFTLIARLIGVGNTGSYFFAITFTTIFTVVADMGLGPILTREAARYPENTAKYFNTVIWSKIFFGITTYLMVVIFSNMLGYSISLRHLIYLSAVTMFFDNIQGAFFSVFRAKRNLIYESFGVVIAQVLTLIIGTTALYLRAPLIWLIAAYTIPSAVIVLYAAFFLNRNYNIRLRFIFDRGLFKILFKMALPFALAGIIGRLYSYSDTIIMSKLLTSEDMGWWSVPYKITFAFQFIPVALSASVYPAMSSLSVTDPGKVGELFIKAWKYLFVIVFPISFGLIAIAEPVIIRLYGKAFLPSVPVMQILLISLIFSYLSIISGALLNATGQQKIQTLILAVALSCNILLNVFLIPAYGIIGAAAAALSSNILLWTAGFYFVRRSTVVYSRQLFKNGFHVLLLAFGMALMVYFLTQKTSFLVTIPIGALVYVSLLFVTGVLSRDLVKSMINKIIIKKIT
ncbi:MAG: flippase [Patescibacteria group bacterium]|jgi:O-antigen/teichoic acid export membrane protein